MWQVHMKAKHLCVDIEKQLLDEDPEAFGDLFLDLAEAYMANGCFAEAKPFLEKLVSTRTYGKAMVWLKYGECLVETSRLEEAEAAYANVVSLAPQVWQLAKLFSVCFW